MFTREEEDRRHWVQMFEINKETYIYEQLDRVLATGPPMSPTLQHRALESFATTFDRLAEPHLNRFWASYNAGNKLTKPTGIIAGNF